MENLLNANKIEELPTSKNYRSTNFEFNNKKYELNISLYSNALFIFLCNNGKISNIYELNIDIENEEEVINIDDEEDNIKDIEIANCILGKRGNDKMNFIANVILTYVKEFIEKINNKIIKLCLAVNLNDDLIKEYYNNEPEEIKQRDNIKKFLDLIKESFKKIFNI